MDPLLRAHATALLLRGTPLPRLGRLLIAHRRDASQTPVLLDPDTGGELTGIGMPAFVLSTEEEATDGNIVRQHWDLSRAEEGGPGIPVLWGHDPDRLLGQWRQLQVLDLGAPTARLTARCDLDLGLPEAADRFRQIRALYLNACSIGWIPGSRTRRSELERGDPHWREPKDGYCGEAEEGYAMGSATEPNHLVECSLVSTPAQQSAVASERLHRGAERAAGQIARGLVAEPADLDRLFAVLANDTRVTAWLERRVEEVLARRSQPAGNVASRSFFDGWAQPR